MSRIVATLVLAAPLLAGGCGATCKESGEICTYAGDGLAGNNGDGMKAKDTRLYYPTDMDFQPGTGRVFIDDWNNEIIRSDDGEGNLVITVGADEPGDGDSLHLDRTAEGAPGRTVSLNHPLRITFSPDGVLFIAAWHNHKVRQWDPATDRVRIVVANSDPNEGTGANAGFSGDGGPAEEALVWFPSSITFDDDGTYYFVDQKNGRVRKVDDTGTIDTVAGAGTFDMVDGSCLEASFRFPDDPEIGQPKPGGAILGDGNGVLWVADTYNDAIRKIDLGNDEVTTIATGLDKPVDLAWAPDGRLYVAEALGHVVSAVDPETGDREIVAGTGTAGPGDDGVLATESTLDHPYGVAVAPDGALWIADTYNSRIRVVTP